MEGAAAEDCCSSVTISIPWTADAAELSFLGLYYWGLLISRVTRLSWLPRSSQFFFIPVFLAAIRINQPPVAVASPKVQEVSLPTTSTFIDGSRM